MSVVKKVTHILNNRGRSFVQWMGAQSIHRRVLRPSLVLKRGGRRWDLLQENVGRRVSRIVSDKHKRDLRRGQRCGNPIAAYEPCWRGKGGADGGGRQRTGDE
jgi:hypothetical protein